MKEKTGTAFNHYPVNADTEEIEDVSELAKPLDNNVRGNTVTRTLLALASFLTKALKARKKTSAILSVLIEPRMWRASHISTGVDLRV